MQNISGPVACWMKGGETLNLFVLLLEYRSLTDMAVPSLLMEVDTEEEVQ